MIHVRDPLQPMHRFLPTLTLSGFLFVAILALPESANGQVRMSPRGAVSQTLDGTKIDIDYGRPALRDREGMFGGQVYWDHVWTPGADEATTLTINKDIKIDGVNVPAGKYSMWFVVNPGDWEVLLNPEWDLFHVPEPERTGDEISFWVTPDSMATLTETLTFDFPTHRNDGAELRFRWETYEVIMDVEVESRLKEDLTQAEVAPYLGTWPVEVLVTDWSTEAYNYDMALEWREERFQIGFKWSDKEDANYQWWTLLALPQVEGIFYPGFYNDDGRLLATAEFYVEFILDGDGAPEGFEIRTPDDELWHRSTGMPEAEATN